MQSNAYCGIYDFELLPYALGDVLTWNVQTAVHALEAGRSKVDVYVCLDPRFPSSIYQRGLVVTENCELYFNELFGAFNTHPTLGNIHVYASRDDLLNRLREVTAGDPVNSVVLADYERVLGHREDADELNTYFIKYIYSHAKLNRFAAERGRFPLLVASRGCMPDINGLIVNVFGDKRIVVVHPRLRRLDYGLAGEHTYFRDSDFLEWYEFIRVAGHRHPEVQFVVVGRLQEKPIELLRLPNVTSLRTIGLGLGHELSLMLQADFFIGTSSGFAAMANFSTLPYFITRMNKESCNAYAIEPGSSRLPFAAPNQILVYEKENSVLLMDLLEKGLALPQRHRAPALPRGETIDVRGFPEDRSRRLYPAATTSRFFVDNVQADHETAFLLWPKLEEAYAVSQTDPRLAASIARRIDRHFPRLLTNFAELRDLLAGTAKPLPRKLVRTRLNEVASKLDSRVLPRWLRGGMVNRAARALKRRFVVRRYP